jgi:hypothetical protein
VLAANQPPVWLLIQLVLQAVNVSEHLLPPTLLLCLHAPERMPRALVLPHTQPDAALSLQPFLAHHHLGANLLAKVRHFSKLVVDFHRPAAFDAEYGWNRARLLIL